MYDSQEVSQNNLIDKAESKQMSLVKMKQRMGGPKQEREQSNTSYNSQTRINNRYNY